MVHSPESFLGRESCRWRSRVGCQQASRNATQFTEQFDLFATSSLNVARQPHHFYLTNGGQLLVAQRTLPALVRESMILNLDKRSRSVSEEPHFIQLSNMTDHLQITVYMNVAIRRVPPWLTTCTTRCTYVAFCWDIRPSLKIGRTRRRESRNGDNKLASRRYIESRW